MRTRKRGSMKQRWRKQGRKWKAKNRKEQEVYKKEDVIVPLTPINPDD